MKNTLCIAPCLMFAEPNDRFFIATDSSDFVIGFVISQERNGVIHPVCFTGRALRDFEKRFPTHEEVALALIEALKQNRRFLQHQEFTVYADSRILTFLQKLKADAGRLGR